MMEILLPAHLAISFSVPLAISFIVPISFLHLLHINGTGEFPSGSTLSLLRETARVRGMEMKKHFFPALDYLYWWAIMPVQSWMMR